MAQSHTLVQALKKTLKAHGLTYRDVALGIGLSEASVKRLFSGGSFSLDRLDQVCALMGLEISDVVRTMESERRRLTELSDDQEQELVSDVKLMLVAFLVVNGWSYEEILSHYSLTEHEAVRHLARLDRLKLIELLPGNRIKRLTSPQFAWRKNGPIHRFFTRHLQHDFFESRFDEAGEVFLFRAGMLSEKSSQRLIEKLEELGAEFNTLAREDMPLPLDQRRGTALVLALRPWRPDVFERLYKE